MQYILQHVIKFQPIQRWSSGNIPEDWLNWAGLTLLFMKG